MHAAITRARVTYVVLATGAAILLALGLAPMDAAVMPGGGCPPSC